MKIKILFIALLISGLSWGQAFTGTYDFASVTTSSGLTDPSVVPNATGVTFGSFSAVVAAETNPQATGRFSFKNWDTGATNGSDVFGGSFMGTKYLQVTITPASGYTLDINSITFTSQRSGTGPRQYAVRSTVDTYGANLPASITANANLSVVATNVFQVLDASTGANAGNTITLDSSFDVLSGAVTFRFYGWNSEGAAGTFSIDNVSFIGVATATSSNTITTNTSLTGSPFCVGNGYTGSVSVPFTISGTFNSGNIFTAQLSNASGSFASPTSIGTLTQTTAGTISATIPDTTPAGTGYRIRVVGDNPATTGSDNGTNLTVNNFAAPTSFTSTCANASSSATWVNPTCFDEVMVVATSGSFTATLPSGTAYTANLAFGSGTVFDGGTVVYKGTGTSSGTITSLVNGTSYTFKIYVRYGATWLAGSTQTCTPVNLCASESFVNIPASSSSYAARSWTGDSGSTWTANNARTDQTITGAAITLSVGGVLTSPSIAGGIGDLTFKAKFPFAESSGTLTIAVNGTPVGTLTFAEMSGTTPITKTISGINVGGNIVVTMTSAVARFTIDDVAWSCYTACTPAANPNGTISVSSSTCGTTTLSYSGSDAATCIWQTTSLGTNTSGTVASTNLVVSSSGTYYVRNYAGSCWSAADVSLAVTVSNNPATGLVSPSSVSIIEGNNTSFGVTAPNGVTFQWQVDTGSGGANIVNNAVYSGATTATLTITGATLAMTGYIYTCIVYANPCTPTASSAATLTVTPNVTYASDLLAIASSEAATISSTVNTVTIASSTDGVKVWEFYVRDGGATLNDTDAYPTILNTLTITKSVGNAVTTWSDAIYSVALFDGATFIASGTVSASQIQFTGLTVSVNDNTQKKLTLRLSLKCPLGAGAIDGDDFGFSIIKANVAFSTSGSGMLSSFTTIGSANGSDVIDVTATKLLFFTQPSTTGINTAMTTVVVKAYDACGNFDSGFTGAVSLTSTGTMIAVTPVNAVAGVATFTSVITHTVLGSGLTLTASATGVTPITSNPFNVVTVTVFNPGELIFVGYDGQVNGSGAEDEYLIATMVDIRPGTQFSIVNSRYEAGAAANVRTNKWGGGGNLAEEPPYVTLITYTGSTNITAGSVLSIITNGSSNWFGQIDVITGTTTTTRTSEFTGSLVFGTTYSPNISVTGTDADEIYLMQGSYVSDGSIDVGQANYILSGTLLHGLTNKAAWVPLTTACNGGTAGGSTRESRLPTALQCFNVENASSTGVSGFYKNDKEHGLATIRQIINAIANVSTNWTLGSGRYTKDPTSSLATRAAKTFSIGTSNPVGTWIGDVSGDNTNWFNCGNWEGLTVPTSTTDVIVNVSSLSDAKIDYTATFSDNYMDIAYSKNLTVSNRKVQLEASVNNILEVHGNVLIDTTGGIDMDDSTSAADGIIKLYGNWTNSLGTAAFSEGNGTVQFVGSTPQIISSVAAEGTEVFYNVVLDNNFDTAVSNDLIASGDLTVKTGRTVSIDSNGFIKAYKKLDHSGTFTIEDNGQFIQVDESDPNVGTYNSTTFKVKRIADVNQSDYVYWSSPTNAFDQTNILSNGMRLVWNTTYPNVDTQGNWRFASVEEAGYPAMTKGRGYAICVPNSIPARPAATTAMTTTFTGKPNNGPFTYPITKGTITADFTNAALVPTTKYDDNWNLVGNPYPSAIDAYKFLDINSGAIEGTLWIWKHGLKPDSTQSPFYQNFTYNYYANDYCKFNKLGPTDPDFASGRVASGQGFMVNMLETLPGFSTTITFNNSLRSDTSIPANQYAPYDNTNFYRTANSNTDNLGTQEEKSRVWLDIFNNASNQTDTTLLGYSTNSTLERDHFYDAIFVPRGNVNLYSLINDETYIIQGRPLPFDKDDKVPMGINITEAGAHTIAIKKVDGIFAEDTNIYLEDKLLNIIHDLKQAPYVFNSEKGIFNNRFILRYTDESLGNDDFDAIDHNVIVSTHKGEMTINSYVESLDEVTVYDILGRQLLQAKSIANNVFVSSNISTSQQALIVKIKLANGTIVTRKIIL
jgi:hypothetical protein